METGTWAAAAQPWRRGSRSVLKSWLQSESQEGLLLLVSGSKKREECKAGN